MIAHSLHFDWDTQPTDEMLRDPIWLPVAVRSCALRPDGFLTFEMWEPMSGQKIFMKRVDVPRLTKPCTGWELSVENSMAQLLETAFLTVMDKANLYFVKEEVELARKQSKELRERKVY